VAPGVGRRGNPQMKMAPGVGRRGNPQIKLAPGVGRRGNPQMKMAGICHPVPNNRAQTFCKVSCLCCV